MNFVFQVDSSVLNLDDLCEPVLWQDDIGIDRVMTHWGHTQSPQVYWTRQMAWLANTNKLMDDLPSMKKSLSGYQTTIQNGIQNGLPLWEENKVCKKLYKNDVVKLTLQVSVPEAMQIKRDVKVTFADQLGVIGESMYLF